MAPFTCSRLPRRPAARDIDDPHNRLSTARVWGSSCTLLEPLLPEIANATFELRCANSSHPKLQHFQTSVIRCATILLQERMLKVSFMLTCMTDQLSTCIYDLLYYMLETNKLLEDF